MFTCLSLDFPQPVEIVQGQGSCLSCSLQGSQWIAFGEELASHQCIQSPFLPGKAWAIVHVPAEPSVRYKSAKNVLKKRSTSVFHGIREKRKAEGHRSEAVRCQAWITAPFHCGWQNHGNSLLHNLIQYPWQTYLVGIILSNTENIWGWERQTDLTKTTQLVRDDALPSAGLQAGDLGWRDTGTETVDHNTIWWILSSDFQPGDGWGEQEMDKLPGSE